MRSPARWAVLARLWRAWGVIARGRRGDRGRGPDQAAHRVIGGKAAQVGEREQGFRADYRGEIVLEPHEPLWWQREGAGDRVECLVDQAEPYARAVGGEFRPGDGGGEHRPDRPLVAEHAAQEELTGERDAFDRIRRCRDRL